MTRLTVDLDTPENVTIAKRAIDRAFAAGGMIAEFRDATRTTDQNKKMWPMLSEIAKARPVWNGFPMNAQRWKGTFMDAMGIETDATPSLEGGRVVPLGHRSSQLSKREFSDLIELIQSFAAKEGIDLKEPAQNETGKAA